MASILLAKFDKKTQDSLERLLKPIGYQVERSESDLQTLELLSKNSYSLVLADINGSNDLRLLKAIKAYSDDQGIIVLSSIPDIDTAEESLKLGAFDFLSRPLENEKIIEVVKKALSSGIKAKDTIELKPVSSHKVDKFHELVGNCEKSRAIYSIIDRISNTRATVLINGESGTGKRMIAKAIHKSDKRRQGKPFIEVSCGALPRDIIESELFGHTKGAFTSAINDRKGRFELADGGTILLDDIDSLPLDLQSKLLRVLQEKEFERVGDHKTIKVDVRVIATTNQDLKRSVVEKKFREDLYYRINVISIHIPSLRERKGDLPLLVEHFVDFYTKENHKEIKGVTTRALEAMQRYDWPGNIRELENIIERAVILDLDNIFDEDDLPDMIVNTKYLNPDKVESHLENLNPSLKEALQEPEKGHILQVLKEVGWNKKKAAEKLGVNRTTLYNKIRKYKLACNEKL